MKPKSQSLKDSSTTGKVVMFKFLAPVYGDLVRVVVTDEQDIIRKYLRQYGTTEESIESCIERESFCAQFDNEEGGLLILRITHRFTWAVLYHEVFHLSLDIMKGSGVQLSPESEEAFTHFGAEIFALVEEGLREHKVKVWPSISVATSAEGLT